MEARIFIVAGHPIFRDSLVSIINDESDLIVCGQADDGAAALRGIEQAAPDLVLIDLKFQQAHDLDLLPEIAARWPLVRILVLSACDTWYYADRLLRAGASGYVMKHEGSDIVLAAIRTVLRKGHYVSEMLKQQRSQYERLSSLVESAVRDGNNS